MVSVRGKACASANAHAGAGTFLFASVRADANASASAFLPSCLWFGATYILVLVGFQDPVSGAACACLRPRFRDFREQTAWPLCTSVRSAVVLEGCHSMVTFAVTNTCGVYSRGSGTDYMASLHFSSLCCRARRMLLNVTHACGVCLRGSGDRLHGLSALRLALLSWLPSHN